MPRNNMKKPTYEKLLEEIRSAPANRVKVAVTDVDGVLRGKYINKEKLQVFPDDLKASLAGRYHNISDDEMQRFQKYFLPASVLKGNPSRVSGERVLAFLRQRTIWIV